MTDADLLAYLERQRRRAHATCGLPTPETDLYTAADIAAERADMERAERQHTAALAELGKKRQRMSAVMARIDGMKGDDGE